MRLVTLLGAKSREMSLNGSTVVDTALHKHEQKIINLRCQQIYWYTIYLQDWQVTSDWSLPPNVLSTIQLQWEELAKVGVWPPRWWCKTSNADIKNSWASCCSYPARCLACVHTKWRSLNGIYGVVDPE